MTAVKHARQPADSVRTVDRQIPPRARSRAGRGDSGVDFQPTEPFEFRIWKSVGFPDKTDMNSQMMLYCLTGGRCALATKSLQDLGFTNVTSVDMKFEDWVKAGNPVVKPK